MYNSFTTVDRILAKLSRELSETDFNEQDVIEMIGEALDFLKVHAVLEPVVSFIEVKDYECPVPPWQGSFCLVWAIPLPHSIGCIFEMTD